MKTRDTRNEKKIEKKTETTKKKRHKDSDQCDELLISRTGAQTQNRVGNNNNNKIKEYKEVTK